MADKNISSLPKIGALLDDTLIPVEQQGAAGHTTGKQLKEHVEKSARLPIIKNGTWWVWDHIESAYADTGEKSHGNGIASIKQTGFANNMGGDRIYSDYTITFDDGSKYVFRVYDGEKGEKGDSGRSVSLVDMTLHETTDDGNVYRLAFNNLGGLQYHYITAPRGPAGAVGPSGDGSGDMVAQVYDPQGKRRDIFEFVDERVWAGANTTVDLSKYGISNDGTNAAATTAGINQALADAIADGKNTVVFPQGTYLIAGDSQIEIGGNLTVDFNHSTLLKEANANANYEMVRITGRHNTVKNAKMYGDRETHDYSDGGTHEWGIGVIVTAEASCATVENVDVFDVTGYGICITGSYNQIAAIREPMVSGCYDRNTGALVESTEYTVLNYTLDVTNKNIKNNMFILGGGGYGGHGIPEPEGYYMTFYNENEAYLGYSMTHCFYDAVDLESLLYQHPTLRYIKFSILNTDTETEATIEVRSSYTSEDVLVRNCEIGRCRTLGIAITGGKRVDIENVKIHDTGGAMPGSAVDIEDGYQLNQYINFRNCAFYNNRYGAINIVKARQVTVDSCDFQGSVSPTASIHVTSVGGGDAESLDHYNYVVKNSTIKEMFFSANGVQWKNCLFLRCEAGQGRFEDCEFRNCLFLMTHRIDLRRCAVYGGHITMRYGDFFAENTIISGRVWWESGTAGSGAEIKSFVLRDCDCQVTRSIGLFEYAPYIEVSGSKIEFNGTGFQLGTKVLSKVFIRDNLIVQKGREVLINITDTLGSYISITGNKLFSDAPSSAAPYQNRINVTGTGEIHIENNNMNVAYLRPYYSGIYVSGGTVASVCGNQIHGDCGTAITMEGAAVSICDNNYCAGTVNTPDGTIGVPLADKASTEYVDGLIGDIDAVIASINTLVGGE